MRNYYIKDYKFSDIITDQVFAVDDIKMHKDRNGNPYYRLILQDRSGDIKANIWSDNMKACKLANLEKGDVVVIEGTVESFNDKLQINIQKLDRPETYDLSELIQVSDKNIDDLYASLLKEIDSISDASIKKFIKNVLADSKINNLLRSAPAAEFVHHDFIGGLLEHIVEMIDISKPLLNWYKEANKDIVIAGIFFHDLGKIEEIQLKGTSFERSFRGKLIGHINEGIEFALKFRPSELSENIWTQIQHIILSHHMYLEFGAAVVPSTIEAAIVACVDKSSSMVRQYQKAIIWGDEGAEFGEYNKYLQTSVYINKTPEENNSVEKAAIETDKPVQKALF